MDKALVAKETADGWRLALHQDLQDALCFLTVEQVQEVVAFAVAEHEHEAVEAHRFHLLDIREAYAKTCRDFRKGDYYLVPKRMMDHCWDIREWVAERDLPDQLQYHPITERLQYERTMSVAYYNDLG